MDIQVKKKQRFEFLKLIYSKTNGSQSYRLDGFEIAKELGIDRKIAGDLVNYLVDEDLLSRAGSGLHVSITHYGIKEIEEAISNPERPTEHFPPVNIISIGSMYNSTIQQSSPGASQNISGYNQEVVPDLLNFLTELKASIDKLNLSVDCKNEMLAEIQTAEVQVKSPKPKVSIIKEAFSTIRGLLEGIATEAMAPYFIEKVKLLLPLIG